MSRRIGSAVFLACCAALAACAGDDSSPAVPTPDGGAPDATASEGGAIADAAPDTGDGSGPPPTTAVVRVANWSPDAPAVDFCFAAHGSASFEGPVLAAAQARALDAGAVADAGAAGLPFPAVSAYMELQAGSYDVRAVAAGGTSCSAGIGSDLKSLPALAVGAFATVALVGEVAATGGDPKLAIVGFLDDPKPKGAVAVRFVNAAPSLARADLGTGATSSYKPLVTGVAFAGTAPPSDAGAPDGSIVVDVNGYASAHALSAATLTIHASGAPGDVAVAPGVTAAKGAVLTIAAIGASPNAPPTEAGAPAPQILECVDNAGTIGVLGSCQVISR